MSEFKKLLEEKNIEIEYLKTEIEDLREEKLD